MPEIALRTLRGELHRCAEAAHAERETAVRIRATLSQTNPDALHGSLGGHGLVAEYRGRAPGPTLLLRCELDAVPIPEGQGAPHASQTPGYSHKCGHDGHMTIMVGLARRLSAARPLSGRVLLLFQPAEETGEGARRILEDPAFAELRPDWAFALHNLPGYRLGHVLLRSGTFACGSRGLAIYLTGATSHAAEPEAGRSPARAIARLIEGVGRLSGVRRDPAESALATVIHARLGEEAFGTSPGEGVVMVTLRGATEAVIDRLEEACRRLASDEARAHQLELHIEKREPFPVTINDPEAVTAVRAAARRAELTTTDLPHPFKWSEDFGHFTNLCRGALFGLGAGRDHPALHHPSYDFPDELLEPGITLLDELIAQICVAARGA